MTTDSNSSLSQQPDPTEASSENVFCAGRRALITSFSVTGILGVLLIFSTWRNTDIFTAVERSIGFVAIVGGIHFIGYRSWQRQTHNAPTNSSSDMPSVFWGVIHGMVGFLIASFFMFSHLCDRHAPLFEIPFILIVTVLCFLNVIHSDCHRTALKGLGRILLLTVIVAFVYLTILHL